MKKKPASHDHLFELFEGIHVYLRHFDEAVHNSHETSTFSTGAERWGDRQLRQARGLSVTQLTTDRAKSNKDKNQNQKKTINNLHRRGSFSPFLVKDRRRVPELPISFAARSTDVYLAPELTGPFGPLGRQTVKRTRDSGDRVDRTAAARAA